MVVVAGCQKDAYWFLHLTSSIPYFLFFIKLKLKRTNKIYIDHKEGEKVLYVIKQ